MGGGRGKETILYSLSCLVTGTTMMMSTGFFPVIPLTLCNGGFVHEGGVVLKALLLQILVLSRHAGVTGCDGLGLALVSFQGALL